MLTLDSSPRPETAMKCSVCPFGHVCLRWRSLNLHLNSDDLDCALTCLDEMLAPGASNRPSAAGTRPARRAEDGFYYLACRHQIILRLTEGEARNLHSELNVARKLLADSRMRPSRVM